MLKKKIRVWITRVWTTDNVLLLLKEFRVFARPDFLAQDAKINCLVPQTLVWTAAHVFPPAMATDVNVAMVLPDSTARIVKFKTWINFLKIYLIKVNLFFTEDLCNPNPCSNGGQCTSTGTGFKCTCPPPFIGLTCQNQDVCAQNPYYKL